MIHKFEIQLLYHNIISYSFSFKENLYMVLEMSSNKNWIFVNPIQDRRQKKTPTSVSPVTSTNVGINLQNLQNFSFDPPATLL